MATVGSWGAPGGRNYSSWQWFVRSVEGATASAPSVQASLDSGSLAAWQRAARRKLNQLVGPLPERVPLNVEVLDSVDCGEYRRDHIVFDSEANMSVPAYLLVPHRRSASGKRGPAVLAQHGHGPGKDEVCGLVGPGGGDEGSDPNTYGHELAQLGYVVLAPDLRTFGERADWEPPNIYSCDHTHTYASMLGYNLLGLDLWDLARGLDVLSEHPLVDRRRIGVVGLSQGGTCALFLAAWDRRVRAAVVSGYFNGWNSCATIGWNMCGSQVLSGIVGQLDHVELGGLIAPRPLLVETGTEDNIFPAPAARAAVAALQPVYAAAGAADGSLQHDLFEGGHRWHGEQAYPFLERWLGPV